MVNTSANGTMLHTLPTNHHRAAKYKPYQKDSLTKNNEKNFLQKKNGPVGRKKDQWQQAEERERR